MCRIGWHSTISLGVLLLTGCGPDRQAPPAAAPPEVIYTLPTTKQVSDYEDFPGHLGAIKDVTITSRVTGYLEKALFKEGSEVSRGDLLFVIDQRPYEAALHAAQASLAESKASLTLANTEFARANELLKNNAIASSDYDQAKNAVDVAKARIMSSEAAVETAQLNLDYCSIRSPIEGRIGEQLIDPGNLVLAGQTMATSTPLTTIVSRDPIYAYFDVDERTILRLRRMVRAGKLKSLKEATIPVYLGLADKEEEGKFPHEGKIDFADNRIDAMSGTLRLRGEFPNHDKLLSPGLFARIRLPIGQPYDALLIPEEALQTDQGQRYVYVVGDQSKVAYRRVKAGRLQEGMRVIEEGVGPGDRVVISGLQRIRPGMQVTAKPAEAAASAASAASAAPSAPEPPSK